MASREEEEIEEVEEGLLLLPPQLLELEICHCPELRLRPLDSVLHGEDEEDRGGLQALRSLRFLKSYRCPKFLSCYSSSSSSFPFPSSLQSLFLEDVETLPPLSNLASLATLKITYYGGDVRSVDLERLLAHGCLQELTVRETTNFFSFGSDSILSSIQLSSLVTDDVTGALAVPICRLLSSSLTKFELFANKEMEHFTEEQDKALQLLTSLQHLEFGYCKKLQSIPLGLHRLTSLKSLEINSCPAIRLLPNDRLPNSLQSLTIVQCSAISSLHKHCLPNSLQELHIKYCPSIRALPKAGLPTSLKLIDISRGNNSEELKTQCRNLIGTIPVVKLDD